MKNRVFANHFCHGAEKKARKQEIHPRIHRASRRKRRKGEKKHAKNNEKLWFFIEIWSNLRSGTQNVSKNNDFVGFSSQNPWILQVFGASRQTGVYTFGGVEKGFGGAEKGCSKRSSKLDLFFGSFFGVILERFLEPPISSEKQMPLHSTRFCQTRQKGVPKKSQKPCYFWSSDESYTMILYVLLWISSFLIGFGWAGHGFWMVFERFLNRFFTDRTGGRRFGS